MKTSMKNLILLPALIALATNGTQLFYHVRSRKDRNLADDPNLPEPIASNLQPNSTVYENSHQQNSSPGPGTDRARARVLDSADPRRCLGHQLPAAHRAFFAHSY